MSTPAQQFQQLQLQVQALTQQSPRPKLCLPELEKFNGTPTKWDTWLPSIEAKLLVDADAIGNSVAQFYYVYLNLESQAQSFVLPQLAATWPDYLKIISFRQGLNSTIRGRLSSQLSLPSTYSAYVATVQQLSAKSTHHVSFQGSTTPAVPTILSRPNTLYQHRRSDADKGDPMEIGQMNSIEINYLGEMRYRDKETEALEDYEDVQARLNGNCMNCGDKYYWAKVCPYNKNKASQLYKPEPWDNYDSGSERSEVE
ncbi:hypothetical protein DL98DRAFT_513355 [Cadophora sp. DSE1049]|nr:hypothetical protein DL98DRAFT_513355 [Cadophora sp. DSE1049]